MYQALNKSVFLFPLMFLLNSCSPTRVVGGRDFPVMITTTKDGKECPGAVAYFVPNSAMPSVDVKVESKEMREAIERFKVTDSRTPVKVYAPSYQFVTFVEWGTNLYKAGHTVVPGTQTNINIELNLN